MKIDTKNALADVVRRRTRLVLWVGACLSAFAGGCHAPDAQAPPTPAAARTPAPAVVPASEYVNPVIRRDFPDPCVLKDRGVYYSYSTNSAGVNLPCERSTDLIQWTPLPDAMPKLPGWAKDGRTWAPSVRPLVPGRRYAAYFAAWDRSTGEEAIGVAIAPAPAGPFTSSAAVPLVTQQDKGGCIDPDCFVDADGSRYLVWKNDGNSRGQDTWLWVQKLSSDGTRLVGQPTQLIKQDQGWEGKLIEAPVVWKHGKKYFLFYSANDYHSCNYAVGYAVASSILGPYVKPQPRPWLSSSGGVCGPGGEDIVAGPGGAPWMTYHSWEGGLSYRSMSIDPLTWHGDTPVLAGDPRAPRKKPAAGT